VNSLTIAIGNYELTKPLKDGSIELVDRRPLYVELSPITAAMRRMVRDLEFDVCEMAFATYICAKAHGKPMSAIPVFLTRNFHHWAIFYNVNSGIRDPKDLEGRRVAVNRGYTVTTGVWARGILQTEFGVDLNKITWMPTDDEHVAEYVAPRNVDYSYRGTPIAELLLSGKVDAAVGDVRVDSPEIKHLIPNAREAGFAYFRKTGVYPINHGLVVKNSLLQADPKLSQELFTCFQAAKSRYSADLFQGRYASHAAESALAISRVVGDPFPFGISANRKAIEAMIQFAQEQQIISRKFTADELFASETVDF
jgi:4,5-dihydroxyphthalate decarboxylase